MDSVKKLSSRKHDKEELKRLLEDEKSVPFKKRKVRFGQDDRYQDESSDKAQPLAMADSTFPTNSDAAPASLQVLSNSIVTTTSTSSASSPEHLDKIEAESSPKFPKFDVIISREDQWKAQDLWCEVMWHKHRPTEPFGKMLHYIELPAEWDLRGTAAGPSTEKSEDERPAKPPFEKRVHYLDGL